MSASISLKPFIPLQFALRAPYKSCFHFKFGSQTRRKSLKVKVIRCSGANNPQQTTVKQQQINLSVLRFTFGIPGLDESYLPRWIGYAFGSLLILNHFLRSDSSSIPPAQIRTEVLGLCLAAFSIVLPYLGKFLDGTTQSGQLVIPEGAEQIFAMSEEISTTLKEDLAWGTYILLRNTNSISVLVSTKDILCVRGYWKTPEGLSKVDAIDWFGKQIQQIGFSSLEDVLYFPQSTDSELWEMLPKGTRSILVQPLLQAPDKKENEVEKAEGFILLASTVSYAYSDKDQAWIRAIANKLRCTSTCTV